MTEMTPVEKTSVQFVHSGIVPPRLFLSPEISVSERFASFPPSTLLKSALFKHLAQTEAHQENCFFAPALDSGGHLSF